MTLAIVSRCCCLFLLLLLLLLIFPFLWPLFGSIACAFQKERSVSSCKIDRPCLAWTCGSNPEFRNRNWQEVECFIGISCCFRFRFLLVPVALRAVAGRFLTFTNTLSNGKAASWDRLGRLEDSLALSLVFLVFALLNFSLICCWKLSGCVTVTVTVNLEHENDD